MSHTRICTRQTFLKPPSPAAKEDTYYLVEGRRDYVPMAIGAILQAYASFKHGLAKEDAINVESAIAKEVKDKLGVSFRMAGCLKVIYYFFSIRTSQEEAMLPDDPLSEHMENKSRKGIMKRSKKGGRQVSS